jgi:signal peptidase I
MTRQRTDPAKPREKSLAREYFELIAETAVFVLFVMTFVVQAFRIPTGSMIPKLLIGDFVLVNKMVYARPTSPLEAFLLPNKPIERKDIIVFKWPGDLTKDYVKRVIGLPGETIEIRGKQLYVNEQPIDEPYTIYRDDMAIPADYGPIVVPPGKLFVLGDNRDDSLDSRSWGDVPLSYVKGRPWIIYFSYDAERGGAAESGLLGRLKRIVTFPARIRWARLLKVIN